MSPQEKSTLARLLRRYGEPAATLGSAMIAEPVAGWAGLLTGNPANVAKTREMLTYAPRSAEGQAGMQALGGGIERAVGAVNERVPEIKALVDAYGDVADYAGELHPVLGAGVKALPAGAAALFGPGGTATRTAFKNVASEALRAGKGLPVGASIKPVKGLTVEGYHFSQQPRTVLDPSAYGTGLKGSARADYLGDELLRNQTSFYVPKMGVITPEAGVGGQAHKSVLAGVYDINADPERLVGATMQETARNIKNAGYRGILNRMEGSQPGQVIMIGPEKIPTTHLGPMSKIEGLTDIPMGERLPPRGRDVQLEALQGMKDLPAGQLRPERWGEMVAKRDPELHARLAETGVFEPGGAPMYKADLVRAIKDRTEAPDYTAPVMAERTVAAPKAVDVAARYKSGARKGNYRGTEAFGGITPQKATAMRASYLRKAEEGAAGRLWYDESSDDIYRWVGGDPVRADAMANMLSATSSQTGVGGNLMFANKGWNQNLIGAPLDTGRYPGEMVRQISALLRDPAASATGLKRSPFSAGLSVRWRGADFANRPTHDIHDVRAYDITDPKTGKLWDKGVPEAGHRFLDTQAALATDTANRTRLAGFDDWTPYRAQAAAWISQKAKTDKTPVAEASRHYGSFAPEYQTQISREWAPGKNTGHQPEYHSLSDAAKQDYARRMEQHVIGREGIDALASDTGALVDRTVPNVGYYEGATEPGLITPVNVGKATGSHAMDPASQAVADVIAAEHGIMGLQKQVAHNFLSGNAPLKSATGVRFPGGFVPDDVMKARAEQLRAFDPDLVPMRDVAGGLRVLNFPKGAPEGPYRPVPPTTDIAPGADQAAADLRHTEASKQLREMGRGWGTEPTFHEMSGNLIPFEAPDTWSAKPFIETIEAHGPKIAAAASRSMQRRAGPLLQEAEALAQEYGLTNAPYYRPMMQGIAEGGLPRLKELVEKGVVPAVFLSVGGEQYDLGP